MSVNRDFKIIQGKTFSHTLRFETAPIKYKPITEITQTAPVRIKVPAHEIPQGWRATVVSVLGMKQINAENDPPRASDYHKVTVVDADHIEFNDVNASGFKPYTGGGYVQFNTPVDLTGFTARMVLKDKVGGTSLFELTTENGRISIDVAKSALTFTLSAIETASIEWKKAVYELELVSGAVVRQSLEGTITVQREVAV